MFHADGMNSKSGYQLRSPILTFRCSNFAGARQEATKRVAVERINSPFFATS